MDDLETVPEEEPKEREREMLPLFSLLDVEEPAEVTESCRPPLVFPIHLTCTI